MALTLDRIGTRYGLLPSQVLNQASTLDIMVMDISVSYEKMKLEQRDGHAPKMTEEDMLRALTLKKTGAKQ